jgi:hypothetical protein
MLAVCMQAHYDLFVSICLPLLSFTFVNAN